MHKSEWKRHWRRVRCKARKTNGLAVMAFIQREDHWARCALRRAACLSRPDAMRCHKLTLIEDCRRALFAISLRLP